MALRKPIFLTEEFCEESKFPKYYYLTLLWTWQSDVVLWLFTALVFRPFFGKNLHFIGLILQCERRGKDYLFKLGKRKFGGMNLGHVALYEDGATKGEGLDTCVERHEHGHGEQWEGNQLFSTLVALSITVISLCTGTFWQFIYLVIPIWVLGGFGIYFARGLQAGIRGEDIYMGNADEESMYSQHNRS